MKDNDRVQSLGSLSIPLSRLLSRSDLSLDQWFQLESSGQASRIYINTVLRVSVNGDQCLEFRVSVNGDQCLEFRVSVNVISV